MGAFGHKSSSSYDRIVYRDRIEYRDPPPNPDPQNFRIGRSLDMDPWFIFEVTYPDCTNYEGKKILVYKNTNIIDIIRQKSMDPHFSDNKKFRSPFARFVPTNEGWEAAIKFCEAMG